MDHHVFIFYQGWPEKYWGEKDPWIERRTSMILKFIDTFDQPMWGTSDWGINKKYVKVPSNLTLLNDASLHFLWDSSIKLIFKSNLTFFKDGLQSVYLWKKLLFLLFCWGGMNISEDRNASNSVDNVNSITFSFWGPPVRPSLSGSLLWRPKRRGWCFLPDYLI